MIMCDSDVTYGQDNKLQYSSSTCYVLQSVTSRDEDTAPLHVVAVS